MIHFQRLILKLNVTLNRESPRIAKNRQQGTTIIAASRLSSVEDADEIIVVEDGTIVEKGTHQELLQQAGWYADTYNLQARNEQLEGRLNNEK